MAINNNRSLLLSLFTVIFYQSLLFSAPITIAATGDLMVGSWIQDVIEDSGYAYPFQNIDSILDDADIIFTNLEAPFGTSGEAFIKTYTFQVNPKLINLLTAGSINLVSLANNHIMDFGAESLSETINLLRENKIHFAGAGMNLSEARKPALLQVNGKKVAFCSYTLTFPQEFWATDTSAGTCFPYHTFVYDDIRRLKAENELVIISCHWGEELRESPKKYQIELAHNLIDAGADIILGHHPHVVQGIEIYKNRLIAYSLGNFIFGSYSKSSRVSMILKIFWAEEKLKDYKIIPINVFNEEVEFQPIPLTGKEKQDFLEKINTLSSELKLSPIVISSDKS